MALIHWRPFLEPLEDLEKDLWEGFHDFFPRHRGTRALAPAVDVYETKDAVVVEAELPGVDPDKVTVSVEDNVLTLKGDSEKKTEVEEKGYYRKEVHRGSFYRQLTLPARVVGDKAEASYDKGLLRVTVPKAVEAQARKINIKINR